MRVLRLLIGLAVIVVAGAVLVGEQLAGTTSDAVINAQVSTLRAPISGTVFLRSDELGNRVQDEEVLGSLHERYVDDVRLNDLRMELGHSRAEARRLQGEVNRLDTQISRVESEIEDYGQQRRRLLEAMLAAEVAGHEALLAEVERLRREAQRIERLAERGVETESSLLSVRTELRVAGSQADAAQQRIERVRVRLEAGDAGIHLDSDASGLSHLDQRDRELRLQRDMANIRLAEVRQRSEVLGDRLNAELVRVNIRRSATLFSNVNGTLWSLEAISGEVVQRGQSIARLVDCDSTVVTVSVPRSTYNSLSVGSSARFRPADTPDVFEGRILRMAGSGAVSVYDDLAVRPSAEELEGFDVAILFPELREHPELGCAIGHTGRVFFEGRPLDFLRGVLG
ncbi:curli assembly protein CsgC [Rhodobacteraceae bacterium WD3A24]|nr:curli assembly protein CsgC [Rhodobacteraceae bacterium WD3A24]